MLSAVHTTHYKWWALATVGTGTLMATIDAGIVNIALPVLSQYFQAEMTTVIWTTLSYLLTVTVTLLTFGRLADILGRRRVYSWGFACFTVGSALCGLSSTLLQLVFFRAIQALGASILFANGGAIITAAFPATERGRALGLNGSIVSVGLTLGPSLGGLLLDLTGWRGIFYVNVPIGILGWLAVHTILRPDEASPQRQPFDFAGAVLLGISLLSLTLTLTQGDQWGWQSSRTGLGFTLALILLIGFILQERRIPYPMVDLTLFRSRLFAAANASAFLSYVAGFANTLLMPFYLQQLRAYSPSETGLILTAVPLTTMFIAPVSGWLSDRLGSQVLSSTGLTIQLLGYLSISQIDANTPASSITLRLIVVGLGGGLFQSPNTSAIMGAVPRHRLGIGSSFVAVARNLGMVTGLALAGAIFASRRANYLALLGETGHALAFLAAFRETYWLAVAILVVGVVISFARGSQR